MNTFGQMLRARRLALGISQEKLASRMARETGRQYKQSNISDFERDRRLNPRVATVRAFARALECAPGDLM